MHSIGIVYACMYNMYYNSSIVYVNLYVCLPHRPLGQALDHYMVFVCADIQGLLIGATYIYSVCISTIHTYNNTITVLYMYTCISTRISM